MATSLSSVPHLDVQHKRQKQMCPICSSFPSPTSCFREISNNRERHGDLYVCDKCGQYIEIIAEERSPRFISIDERLTLYPKSSDSARRFLSGAAYVLCEEIHSGKWDNEPGVITKPGPECEGIIAELTRRCPGFTNYEYKRAIASGLFESR